MQAPDIGCRTLHIRCGSDIFEALREAGFAGELLEYSNPYCRGPVAMTGDMNAARVAFIARSYGVTVSQASRKLVQEQAQLETARDYERVVLWFEHDGYDQLILARLLAHFERHGTPPQLELVCVDRYPGVEPFYGLGQLEAAQLLQLWKQRRPVSREQLELGREVWAALRQSEPRALHRITERSELAIPLMRRALVRHLQELPSHDDGLSLTEREILELLADGARDPVTLFREWMARDPLPFLGNLMFFADVRALQAAATPLVTSDEGPPWERAALRLTAMGRRVVGGDADWISLRPRPRWVGGVLVTSGPRGWRWDGSAPVRMA